jgi:hypothetical protein
MPSYLILILIELINLTKFGKSAYCKDSHYADLSRLLLPSSYILLSTINLCSSILETELQSEPGLNLILEKN